MANARAVGVDKAFESQPLILREVKQLLESTPSSKPLLDRISDYIFTLQDNASSLPHSKKARTSGPNAASASTPPNDSLLRTSVKVVATEVGKPRMTVADTSFQQPIRKKLDLQFTERALIALLDPRRKDAEFLVLRTDIAVAFCVPTPEKLAPNYTYCVLPRLRPGKRPRKGGEFADAIVWTVIASWGSAFKPKFVGGFTRRQDETLKDMFDCFLSSGPGERPQRLLVEPRMEDFCSAKGAAGSLSGPTFHVAAHQGAKAGFLWFLSQGILWGLKKPVAWYAHERIARVGFASVLARTFNLSLVVKGGEGGEEEEEEEVEYGMLDVSEQAGVARYLAKYNLTGGGSRAPSSSLMAVKGEDVKADGGQHAMVGQSMEAQMQDAEDAEEEDFDPEAEDSEDGSSSSEDEEADGAAGADGVGTMDLTSHVPGEGRSLAEEELGSEMEDVGEQVTGKAGRAMRSKKNGN